MSAYRALEARFREIADVEGALAVLHWDQQVMMPDGGAEARGQQIATLEQIAHGLMVASDTRDWLEDAEAEELEPWPAANRREMRRHVVHASAVPAELVGALALATARAEQAWRKGRAAADFELLRPALEEVVTLVRVKAAAKAEALGLAPYDALLDSYEPGVRMAAVDSLLGALETALLPGLIDRAIQFQKAPLPLPGPLPKAAQKALGQRLMTALGFDFTHGRLDESLHPFCGGVPDDIRMTARYEDGDVASGLMAILHETGHALYNAGLPRAWRRQPVGEPRSYALHESQSLLIEMQVCRSRAFLSFLAPLLQQAYGRAGDPALAPDNLYRRAIRVSRSLIRVDADEITYPLHIILRYRLEQALLGGTLEVADLPGAWRDGMQGLLGIVPPDDRLGCLQDIHWAGGAFGYFPCYTLGALIAAQLFEALAADHPDLEERLGAGDFVPLLAWLRSNVHERGCLLEPTDLVIEATGRPLEVDPFLRHLERRYLTG